MANLKGFWARLTAWPRSLSLAAIAAWITFLLLLLIVIVVWTIYFADSNNFPYRDWISWPRILTTLGLVIALPIVAYYGLRLWLEGDAARFPDIDYAWKAGVEALRRAGLSLDGAPLFLIIGPASEREAKQLLESTGNSFRVAGVPEGRSPLCWYANPDGIWLFCTETGWLSALAKLAERKLSAGLVADEAFYETPTYAGPARSTSAPAAPEPMAPAPAQPQAKLTDSTRGTIILDQFVLQNQPTTPAPAPVAASMDGTLRPGAMMASGTTSTITRVPHAERVLTSNYATQQPAIVAPHDSAEQLQRLEYVCQLLRTARQPLCAANGILALVAFEQLLSSPPEVEELQRAIKSDLLVVQRGLGMRCPTSALVIGMERERGFRELVRRVGPDRAAGQRFGRRYDLRAESSPEALANFSAHVGGVFEDWIYTLFRENQALSRPGNTTLYGLLCKMRCNVKPRLGEIMAGGFGYDQRQTPHDDPLLFSGCYFAATGETSDRQAFVRGVLEKLLEEQENVEWTRQTLADEHRSQRLVYAAITLGVIFTITLVGVLVSRWL